MIYVCANHLTDAHHYARNVLGLEWTGQPDGEYRYDGARVACWPHDLAEAGEDDELHVVGDPAGKMIEDLFNMATIMGVEAVFVDLAEQSAA